MKFSTLLPLGLSLAANNLSADVTSWRNGGFGLYPDTTAPIDWDNQDNVLWKIDTPIRGNATPIVVGQKLFYTAEPGDLICADANTGKTLWRTSNSFEDVIEMPDEERREIKRIIEANENLTELLEPAKRKVYELTRKLRSDKSNEKLQSQLEDANAEQKKLEQEAGTVPKQFIKPKTHDTNGYASMTACSDGTYIYTGNGMGIVTKHDLNGNRIWGKVMEGPDHAFGTAVSPQLIGGKLILRMGDYAALDPESGKELWRIKDPATFGPPASFQLEDEWYLYTVRGELMRVSDGKKLPSQDWDIPEKKFAFFNTPFVGGNRVYVVHGAAGIQGDAYCMEIPSTKKALEKTGLTQVWYSEVSKERYYASPVTHQGITYIISMGNEFQALDAATGELLFSKKIDGMKGRAFTGVTLVGDKLLVGEENGLAVFIQPGPTYKEHARFDLGENRSTPIFDGDTAYLRTIEYLIAYKSR
ncbi:MAG: PQQ-binding-like beta-propeller repeat protein [Verrucomicrobia bacterium]|nr:PQQ-binding-like beta-propeller repeat protein [Verrucomicrobiota bacterium]MDA1065018.1 PQQ-binding-like beta-propeller repeat protein [Verrucomicrobiota bacterium]